MNPVKATFETRDQSFADGVVPIGFLLTLTPVVAGEGDQVVEVTSLSAPPITATAALDAREITVADVPVGTYVGKIALVDASGAELAPAVVDPAPIVIVEAQTLSFPVPTSLTLTRP